MSSAHRNGNAISPQTVPHGRYTDQPIEAVPEHHQQWMRAMNASVELLLAGCDRIRRGSEIDRPTRLKSEGERHAQAVAARDSAVHCGQEPERPIT